MANSAILGIRGMASTASMGYGCRMFSSSSISLRSIPRKVMPSFQPNVATPHMLSRPLPPRKSVKQFPPRSTLPPHMRFREPSPEKWHITDIEQKPVPTVLPAGMTLEQFKTITRPPPITDYHFPYRYYQITLRRGLIGITSDLKHVVQSLGLHRRHQVVWRMVSPRSAGQILRIKELVHVRLVNELPTKEPRPTGFSVLGPAF